MPTSPLIDKESLIVSLHELGAVKFGEVVRDSGRPPVQIDLQVLASRPATLRRVSRIMQTMTVNLKFDRVAAIPMGGLMIGISLSMTLDVPMIYPRLQGRESSVSRYLAGQYNAGETVLLIDDDLEQGNNQLGTISLLETVRLKVTDVMILLDREVGGRAALEEKGYNVHAILTMPEIVDTLMRVRRITPDQHKFISDWWQEKKAKFSTTF